MIFATVGTTKFPFDQMLKAVDEAMIKLNSKEKLIVQKGEGVYCFKYPYTQIFKEIPFNKIVSYFKKARIIITHGGPASIFLTFKYGKNLPVVIPRLKRYNEHISDHQYYFCLNLIKKGLISGFLSRKNLVENLIKYFKNPQPKMPKMISWRPDKLEDLVQKLIEYTEKIKSGKENICGC